MNDLVAGMIAGILGLGIGAIIAWLLAARRRQTIEMGLAGARERSRLQDEQLTSLQEELGSVRDALKIADQNREAAQCANAAHEERLKAYEDAEERLRESFASLGGQALKTSTDEFLKLAKTSFDGLMKQAQGDVDKKQQAIDGLIKPIRELLDKQHKSLIDFDKQRAVEKQGLEEQLKAIAQSHEKLGAETNRLVTALRRPEQRGRWGEMQLRNAVEMAGMSKHCDFLEQPQTDDPVTRDRPDMIVNLPGEGAIVVDSKVALDAYLDAMQPDAERTSLLARHAAQVSTHVRQLSAKRYWDQFDRTPKLVVMFMPLESALTAALEVKPDLHADAMQQHVLIATPTLLVALLRAVAYGWQQENVAANAREISAAGKELFDRLSVFVGHFDDAGKSLNSASKAYNRAVASLQSRLLPGARKLKELHVTTDADVESPRLVEIEVNSVSADELRLSPKLPEQHATHASD